MKKISVIFLILALFSPCLMGGDSLFFNLRADLLIPSDDRYVDTYSGLAIGPGCRLGWRFLENLYLWGDFIYIPATGETVPLQEEAKSNQYFISAGLGWESKIASRMFLDVFGGATYVMFEEQAADKEVSDNAVGFMGGIGLRYMIYKGIFFSTELSYVYGQDTVNQVDIKLGGPKAGLGFGVRF